MRKDATLRGAMRLYLELNTRADRHPDELIFTAATGRIIVAYHPGVPQVPIGLALLLPCDSLPKGRATLFTGRTQGWGESEFFIQYGLSMSPVHMDCGRSLMRACQQQAGSKRLVSYVPLVGLRARVIQIVDHAETFHVLAHSLPNAERDCLREQLSDLLAHDTLPKVIPETVAKFLKKDSLDFAEGKGFRLGEFHRRLRARLVGIDHGGDPEESDSMWARAYLEYPELEAQA